MNGHNYLNVPPAKRDSFIYRIICVQRLLELFDKRQNVLAKPKEWDDPFENFILRSQEIYGQCWTLQRASDAMWRIYSQRSDAVRIRSTVRRLVESLHQTRGRWAHIEAFIGRVQYLRNEKLMAFARNARQKALSSPERTLANTLLIKRPAFRHEREIRLIFIPRDKAFSSQDLFRYDIDPNVLIDQMMIDPRLSVSAANTLKQTLRAKTGFRGEIKRSLLYAPPPNFGVT